MSVISRLAAITGRSLARLSVAKPAPCYSTLLKPRFFSSTRTAANQSSVGSELVEALENEINAEKRLENENLGGATRPSIPGFTVSTNEAEVRLTKQFGSENILVVFNVNHTVDVEEDESPDAAPMPMALPPFSVEITKGDKRLCFNLSTVEAGEQGQFDFRVEEFYITPAGSEEVADHVYASSGRYIDPDLHDILFVRYLEERGFDDKFCQELVDFATWYEHDRYMGLLKDIKDFVAKN